MTCPRSQCDLNFSYTLLFSHLFGVDSQSKRSTRPMVIANAWMQATCITRRIYNICSSLENSSICPVLVIVTLRPLGHIQSHILALWLIPFFHLKNWLRIQLQLFAHKASHGAIHDNEYAAVHLHRKVMSVSNQWCNLSLNKSRFVICKVQHLQFQFINVWLVRSTQNIPAWMSILPSVGTEINDMRCFTKTKPTIVVECITFMRVNQTESLFLCFTILLVGQFRLCNSTVITSKN